MLKLYLRGKGEIKLNQNDFITSGGEGKLYGKGSIIYKIYNNKKIEEGKVKELQSLNHKNIIIPKNILLDKNNNTVGFSMDWKKDTFPLCKFFTNTFRNANKINDNTIVNLIESIKDTTKFLHSKKCLIVDGNEFNYLVNTHFNDVYFIDVDSYQTPNYPATAIMPNIRDPHSKKFNEMTDWYSFGIIACQLFVGIHPYKGKHPKYKKHEIKKRAQDNISIFNKDTTVPKTMRDFSHIPNNYFHWLVAIFEDGKRLPPPSISGAFSILTIQQSIIENNVDIKLIKQYDSNILFYCDQFVKLKNDIIIIKEVKHKTSLYEEIIITKKKEQIISIKIDKFNKLKLSYNYGIEIQLDIFAEDKMIIDDVLYIKSKDKLLEITFEDSYNKVIPIIKSWSILPNATTFYSGVVYSNILGKPFLLIPIKGSCHNIQINELEGYKIINAKYNKKICCIIGYKKGKYDLFILRFDSTHISYDYRKVEDISDLSLNFVVKNNGTVVMLIEDNIEVFCNNIKSRGLFDCVKIKNTNLPLPIKLYTDGNRILFTKENQLSTMTMRR